jgi:curved DNA-binding protein CbpA
MRDLYKSLGLTSKATSQEIKKAYRSLALKAHSDKGGDDESMALLNDAYATLSDPSNRRDFESKWQSYQETSAIPSTVAENYLPAGDSVSYSTLFREEHKAWITQYHVSPLLPASMYDSLLPWSSNLYTVKSARGEASNYHDIFSFIRAKEQQSAESHAPIPTRTLSPVLAINIFSDFLAGQYYGKRLLNLNRYFSSAISGAVYSYGAHERLLYEGISEIMNVAELGAVRQHTTLLASLQKLTEFAKKTQFSSSEELTALFYNAHFRALYGYALHMHWEELVNPAQERSLMEKVLQQLDGYQQSIQLLQAQKERLSSSAATPGLGRLVQTIRLLSQFEKEAHDANARPKVAKDLRETAFHLLDWINFFSEYTNLKVLINVCLQIALKFQEASQVERHPVLQMADQKLALKLYKNALHLGKDSTPDIELYVSAHVLKQMMLFKFQDEGLKRHIPILQKRILVLADFFPFAEALYSNIGFYLQEKSMVVLLRHLLNTMVNILEHNKTTTNPVILSHRASTIFYYAYEACLNNWYQSGYDAELEEKIRLELMENLLADRHWTFFDLEVNLNAPWIMVDRDENGWLSPTRSLPYGDDSSLNLYRAINGAEINNLTGEITFYLTPWSPERPAYEKAFSLFDLQEMLEKNITEGTFSLDQVDPDKKYHPFQKMRLEPTQLDESELLNTMLLTDYVLKFLTTNQEVQAQYPFNQRSISQMILHLPQYLRNIMERFHSSQKTTGVTHRFWIEAEAIDLNYSGFARGYSATQITESKTKLEVGQLKMVVKKHRMEHDMRGELKDTHDDEDGWPIYVLTENQFKQLQEDHQAKYNCVAFLVENELNISRANKSTVYLQQKNGSLTAYWFGDDDSFQHKSLPLSEVEEIFEVMHAPILASWDANDVQYILSKYEISYGKIYGKAMIFIENKIRLFYWENHQLLQKHVPEDAPGEYYETILCQIYSEPKEPNGRILPTSNNMPLLVRAIQVMSQQSGQPDYLSAEFMFAHEFTTHYEEFAQYLPEFGRLRELSRITVLINYLNRIREVNKRKIEVIDLFVSGKNIEKGNDPIVQIYQEKIDAIKQKILTAFTEETNTQDVARLCPSSTFQEVERAFFLGDYRAIERMATKEVRSQLLLERTKNEETQAGFDAIGFAKENPPEKRDLEEVCFWVPSSVHHEVNEVYAGGASRHSFFVYGGVSIHPKISVKDKDYTPFSGAPIRAADLAAAGGGGGRKGPPGNGGKNTTGSTFGGGGGGSSGGGGGKPPTSGNGNGNRGDGSRKPKRFEQLVLNATRDEVRNLMREGRLNLTEKQIQTIRQDIFTSGAMNSVNIRKMYNGNVHISCERPGRASGFQRMSFKLNENGVKLRVVQTAFDDNNNLVHQKQGASKNNLYDVKK